MKKSGYTPQKKKASAPYTTEASAPLKHQVAASSKKEIATPSKHEDEATANNEEFSQDMIYLKDIQRFDKSRLKKTNVKVKSQYDDDEQALTIQLLDELVTLNQHTLCYSIWDSKSYPVHEIKSIIHKIPETGKVTLNFAGVAVLTDTVFAVIANFRETGTKHFEAVVKVVLDGCHLITDSGLAWMGKAFPKLSSVSLIGCHKITDNGLVYLNKLCPELLSVDLSSTNINFLPKVWSKMEKMEIKAAGCPLLYPMISKNTISGSKIVEPLKDDKESLIKVCILRREGTTASILAAIKGEKQPVQVTWPQIMPNVELDKNLTAMVIEADQSLSSMLVTNCLLVVIPCELADERKLSEETASIFALIIEILVKFPNAKFVIAGCNMEASAVDKLLKMVGEYHRKSAELIKDTNYFLWTSENMSVAKQLECSRARKLHETLSILHIDALTINLNKPDNDSLFKDLAKAARSMLTVNEISYSKQIYHYAKEFPSKYPMALQSGIHTINEAADIVSQSSSFNEKLRSFGAIHFLASIGKLTLWKNRNGDTLVASTSWLCKCLQILCSPDQESIINNGLDHTIADEASVWMIEKLMDEAKKKDLDWLQIQKVLHEFPYLWLSTSNTLTVLAHLPEKPSMSKKIFTDFDKKNDENGLHIMYNFILNHNITPAILQEIIASAIQLHRPIHLWKTGVIIYDSIVAVMIEQTDYSKVLNLCAYMTSAPKEGMDVTNSNAKLIHKTIEKYRIIVTHVLTTSGFIWEEMSTLSDSLYQSSGDTTGVVHSHKLNIKEPGVCSMCGTTSKQSSMLTAMEATLDPEFLTANNMKCEDLKGELNGSLFELTGPCEINSSVQLDPLGSHQCSVLLIHGRVHLLKILFISPEKNRITIDLGEKKIFMSTADKEMTTYDISHYLGNMSLEGEIVTAKIKETDPFGIDIYLGPQLMQSVPVPYSRYSLVISSDLLPLPMEENFAKFAIQSSSYKSCAVEIRAGMKLEATDRLNPHLICVATIDEINPETGKVLIHFDGWTKRYDYWTNMDHNHLHPIGYMHHRGKELEKSYNIRSELQAPYGYTKVFDWQTYLKEVGAEPVPYACFNKKQTEGIPDDIVRNIQSNLGSVFPMSEKAHSLACSQSLMRAECIEHQAKVHIKKLEGNQEYEKDLSMRKHIVCLLPLSLSVESLRFPSLDSVFSDKVQMLHFLCPGQALDMHHVNHQGLQLVPKQLKLWLTGLLNTYAHLIMQKRTLPYLKDDFCFGADKIPESKWPYLEAALKRLYKLYLMHCIFAWTGPMDFDAEQNGAIELMLDEALKSEDRSFTQQFSCLPGTTQVLCHAHKLANSPSSGLLELTMDKFQSLASNIYVVHLESNPLSSLQSDFFTHFVHLTYLGLDDCKLTELPSFQRNVCLEEIHVRGNLLSSLPDDMKQLELLRVLDISNNPLEILPSVISSLKSLVELYADNVGAVDLKIICPLKNLTKLSVGQNCIDQVPNEITTLPLTVLDVSGLPLMPRGLTFSIHSVNKHMDQYTVYRKIPAEERQKILEAMESIEILNSSSAKISEFNKILLERYPRLGKMEVQEDDSIPNAIMNITTLERLVIPHQAFKVVPDSIKNLTKLEHLNVGYNPCLETISAQLATLPIKELHLKDCFNLKTPPREIVQRGFLAIFGFLKRLLQGSVSCKRTKLMMVGLGGAGKTSLVNALTSETHQFYQNYSEMITDGINISEWVVPINQQESSEDTSEYLHFSVWDFAGQTIYYNTHQFFLSNRAVYLLLWNIRQGSEHAGLDFWLSSIACHAPKAPIFVVGSHSDKVQKGKLPKEDLKRRFPQIAGFHFISSYTGEGIAKLKEELIQAALSQKYMGEMIPEAWLSLETRLDNVRRNDEKALLPWSEIEGLASEAGIFDYAELVQAVQFLHDLGSVQFFNTSFLRSYVVIIPQWIIDVMACVVTVHESPTKDGKLFYADMQEIWQKYPKELHSWLLRLTEEFDLTFPLKTEEANIVPCLLSNTEPKFDFPGVDKKGSERESRLLYRFEYLPAGLFNRAQVRLHEFSDSSVMWKKGVLLRKNNHRALLLQVSNTEVAVTARGYKPENTLFLVHEVFECLIADSYSGVSYDYSIPCVECLGEIAIDPCMFQASKIKRASDMKVPFLQCDKHFHIISIPEIQAIMPPDNTVDFDDHLGRSVRELQDLQTGLGIHVLFIYTRRNIPDLINKDKVVDPTKVLQDLRTAGCNVSYCDNPETANMESMTIFIKSAQVVVFGVSDEFVADAQCSNLLIYTKETLHKAIVLLALGKTLNWQKKDINLILADEVFVKMTSLSRYESKLPELLDSIKSRCVKKKVVYPECFISYAWANSQTAVDTGSATVDGAISWGDPRKIKEFLQSKGVNCWLDVEQIGQKGFFEDIAHGLRKAKVMVACVSDEYANSSNCKMEFRFAVSTLKIPTVLAVVGTGYNWERSEIGLLTVGNSMLCPKINLQYENETGLLDLLKEVQGFLSKSADVRDNDHAVTQEDIANKQSVAFQEALELAQRKMLRHIVLYSGMMDMESYPRLVLVDLKLIDPSLKVKEKQTQQKEKVNIHKKRDPQKDFAKNTTEEATNVNESEEKNSKYCFRLLCEHEQGWHEAPGVIGFPKMEDAEAEEFLKSVSPYLARIFAIIKHCKLNLPILTSPEGELLCKKMEEWCPRTNPDFQSQYKSVVQMVLDEDEKRTYGGLKRCQMPNGKILWLCEKHENSSFPKGNKQNGQGQGQTTPDMNAETGAKADLDSEKMKINQSEMLASKTNQDQLISGETLATESEETRQIPVKLVQPSGQVLPRRPKLIRRGTSNIKTTSQACRLM